MRRATPLRRIGITASNTAFATIPAQRCTASRCVAAGKQPQRKRLPHGSLFDLVTSAPSVRGGPDPLLGEIEQTGENGHENHDLKTDPLALLELRLGGPHQERSHVRRILINLLWRPVVISHLVVR